MYMCVCVCVCDYLQTNDCRRIKNKCNLKIE